MEIRLSKSKILICCSSTNPEILRKPLTDQLQMLPPLFVRNGLLASDLNQVIASFITILIEPFFYNLIWSFNNHFGYLIMHILFQKSHLRSLKQMLRTTTEMIRVNRKLGKVCQNPQLWMNQVCCILF